jgi:hypothetical protein
MAITLTFASLSGKLEIFLISTVPLLLTTFEVNQSGKSWFITPNQRHTKAKAVVRAGPPTICIALSKSGDLLN